MRVVQILLCILVLFLAACSDSSETGPSKASEQQRAVASPKDTVIPKDPAQWDRVLTDAMSKLSEEDQKLLAEYFLRLMKGTNTEGTKATLFDIPGGMTIGQAIEVQKKYLVSPIVVEEKEAKTRALREEGEQKFLAMKAAVERNLMVEVLNLGIVKYDQSQEYHTISVRIANKSEKDITAIKGTLVLTNQSGKHLGEVSFKMNGMVGAGKTLTWNDRIESKPTDRTREIAKQFKKQKYQSYFRLKEATLADGEKLEYPGVANLY